MAVGTVARIVGNKWLHPGLSISVTLSDISKIIKRVKKMIDLRYR